MAKIGKAEQGVEGRKVKVGDDKGREEKAEMKQKAKEEERKSEKRNSIISGKGLAQIGHRESKQGGEKLMRRGKKISWKKVEGREERNRKRNGKGRKRKKRK